MARSKLCSLIAYKALPGSLLGRGACSKMPFPTLSANKLNVYVQGKHGARPDKHKCNSDS